MAKKKTKRRRKNGFTIPLAIVAGFIPGFIHIQSEVQVYGFAKGMQRAVPKVFLAYNAQSGQWGKGYWHLGIGPMVLGFLGHYVAKRVGVNRVLANANVPLLRI